ncbi:MAG: hypothetical protein OXD39_07700 [Gemmatimonadetes bacterium]|nr:hypothetical protein [Gemmatimonadota bacterium]
MVLNIAKDAIQAGKAVFDMSQSRKKSASTDSEIDREFKSLIAGHRFLVSDQKRVLRKIERIVDAKAKEQGISFNKDQ